MDHYQTIQSSLIWGTIYYSIFVQCSLIDMNSNTPAFVTATITDVYVVPQKWIQDHKLMVLNIIS